MINMGVAARVRPSDLAHPLQIKMGGAGYSPAPPITALSADYARRARSLQTVPRTLLASRRS